MVLIVLLFGLADIRSIKKLHINKYQFFLFLIAIGIFVFFITEKIFNKQLIEIFVIIYILLLSFFYNTVNNQNQKMLYIPLFISSLSILFIYLSTPLSPVYWKLHGGRLFIGETDNPNLVAFVSMINILILLYILFKIKQRTIYKTFLFLMIPFSMYLYFMSFSKSSFVGVFLISLYLLFRYSFKIVLNLKAIFLMIAFVGIVIYTGYDIDKYIEIITKTINSLLNGSSGNMSASIRHENFKYFFDHYSSFNMFGYGANTFRIDSPILQLYIEYGFFISLIFFVLLVIIPLLVIFSKKDLLPIEEYTILLYLFYFPSLFFHGTPYEWHTWLPVVLFYMILKKRKKYYVITNNLIHIPSNTKRNY